MSIENEKLRIDKYLWAIRLFKTRAQAADACDKGKVKWNGNSVKPSKSVQVGDEYEVKNEVKRCVIKVVSLLPTRVQYQEAIKNYIDITPPGDETVVTFHAPSFNTGKRQSKIGRPTKKQRRDLDDLSDSNL